MRNLSSSSFSREATLRAPRSVLPSSWTVIEVVWIPRGSCSYSLRMSHRRFDSAKVLARPEVEELLASAVTLAKPPLPVGGRGRLVIRSVSAKQRPRRKRERLLSCDAQATRSPPHGRRVQISAEHRRQSLILRFLDCGLRNTRTLC